MRRTASTYRLARQLRRTLITQDRDYLDDRKFPPDQSGGVLVLWAPGKGIDGVAQARRSRSPSADRVLDGAVDDRGSRRPSKGASSTCTSTGTESNRTVIVVSGGDLILPGRVDEPKAR